MVCVTVVVGGVRSPNGGGSWGVMGSRASGNEVYLIGVVWMGLVWTEKEVRSTAAGML